MMFIALPQNDFNPRSRVGSDNRDTGRIGLNGDFNPRSRVGSDRMMRKEIERARQISIHAPA